MTIAAPGYLAFDADLDRVYAISGLDTPGLDLVTGDRVVVSR